MTKRNRILGLLLVTILAWPAAAGAQGAAAVPSLVIPPNVRAEGMGRAYAPLDRSAMAAWGNPGALGLVRGVEVAVARMKLVPDLAPDVFQRYQVLVVGKEFMAGKVPLTANAGINRTHLSYGQMPITGPGSPTATGTGEPTEETIGVTLALGLWDLIGAGLGIKWVDVDFSDILENGKDNATTVDYGFFARTPTYPPRREGEAKPVWGISFLGAVAWANRGGEIKLDPERKADPLPAVRRESLGMDLDFFPASHVFRTDNRWLSKLIENAHFVSVAAAFGRETDLVDYDIPEDVYDRLTHYQREGVTSLDGFEIRFLDVLAIRSGGVFDARGQIKGDTFGWGLSWLGYAGVDYAKIPQYEELSEVTKWSFWFKVPF